MRARHIEINCQNGKTIDMLFSHIPKGTMTAKIETVIKMAFIGLLW